MATNAFIGLGGSLARGDTGSATNFVNVAEVKDISGFGQDAPEIEVTHLASTAEEFIAGVKTANEFTATANFDPSSGTQDATTGIIADQQAGTVRYWRITLNDTGATTMTFQGFVKSFTLPSIAPKASVDLQFVVKRSGDITWA